MTDKETTSTSTGTGDEVNKGSDLVEILNDGRTTLDHYGPEYLKPEQLLEVLISPRYSGKTAGDIAADLLKEFGDLKDVVTASIPQLTKVKGIGFVKACQIKAAFELSKRIASYHEEDHQDILLTQQLCMCGVILGIEVLDHVIIGSNHVSMKDQKLM